MWGWHVRPGHEAGACYNSMPADELWQRVTGSDRAVAGGRHCAGGSASVVEKQRVWR